MESTKRFNYELRPCAHCGADTVRIVRTIVDNVPYWRVECYGCGMRTIDMCETTEHGTPNVPVDTMDETIEAMDDAINAAVTMWNMRERDNVVDTDDDTDEDTQSSASSEYTIPWLEEAKENLSKLFNAMSDYIRKGDNND